MARYHFVTLPGDGIGPEVMAEGLRVLRAVEAASGAAFEVEEIPCGGKYYLAHGRDWPEGSEARCRAADAILLGAVGWPSPDGPGPVTMKDGRMAGWSAVIGNRTRLDLFANVRPVKLYPGVGTRIHGQLAHPWQCAKVDMVIVRENTEDLYCDAGGTLAPGGRAEVAVDTRIITRRGSERVIRHAFELARARDGAPSDGKRRVTAILKDNVLEGCRLFREVFVEVGKEFPDVEKETNIVDSFTQWLMTTPERYDVCVTTNMFGDIVTDLASVLQGGMGLAVGCNVGAGHAMFEPIHGSAPQFTGKDQLNPVAMILAVKEALAWLGARKGDAGLVVAAGRIEAAVRAVLAEGPRTMDIAPEGQAAGTRAVGDAIVARLGG